MNEEKARSAAPGLEATDAAARILPIIEESIRVEKRMVERGGFRLTKTVTTHEETVDASLISSEFAVERREIGELVPRDVTPSVRTQGDTTIYPVLKEVLVTEKRLMLVAEIRVRRIELHYHDPQTVVLRKEEIHVERLDPESTPVSKLS